MIRNLKAIGLTLFAVLALAALGAQSASAVENHSFTSDSASGTTILTGATEVGTETKFRLTNALIGCKGTTYRGTVVGAAVDHISVVPIFGDESCTSNIGAATIHNNGCTYTLDSDTFENTAHFGAGPTHANVSLACGHTGSITVTSGGCTIHFGTTHTNGVIANHNLPGLRYDVVANHSGGKSALTVTATVKTIAAETTGANCPLLGLGTNGTHVNGTHEGKAIVTCYTDNEATTKNPHTNSFSEGALVNCGLSTP